MSLLYGNRFQILSCFLEKHSRGGWMSRAETWVSFASFHFQLVYNIPIFVIEPSLLFFFSCSHDTTGKLLNSLNINLLLQRKKSKKISCFFIFLFFLYANCAVFLVCTNWKAFANAPVSVAENCLPICFPD